MPLLLGYNETISSNTCCCRYASMFGAMQRGFSVLSLMLHRVSSVSSSRPPFPVPMSIPPFLPPLSSSPCYSVSILSGCLYRCAATTASPPSPLLFSLTSLSLSPSFLIINDSPKFIGHAEHSILQMPAVRINLYMRPLNIYMNLYEYTGNLSYD